jgi:hypothetical protein
MVFGRLKGSVCILFYAQVERRGDAKWACHREGNHGLHTGDKYVDTLSDRTAVETVIEVAKGLVPFIQKVAGFSAPCPAESVCQVLWMDRVCQIPAEIHEPTRKINDCLPDTSWRDAVRSCSDR